VLEEDAPVKESAKLSACRSAASSLSPRIGRASPALRTLTELKSPAGANA